MAVSPIGPEAGDFYVANYAGNTVSVINPATNTVIATIPVGSGPDGVAVSPTGPEAGDVYVTNIRQRHSVGDQPRHQHRHRHHPRRGA